MRTRRDPSTRILSHLDAIAQRYNSTVEQLRGKKCKFAALREARRECYLWLRSQGWSCPQIGWLFDRDHSSIMHQIDPGYRERKNQDALKRYHMRKYLGAQRV